MKRNLLCALFALGLTLGSTSALLAENAADAIPASEPGDTAAVAAPADTLTVLAVPAPTVAATDSLFQVLDQRMSDLEQTVNQIRSISSSHSDFNGEYVMVFLVVTLISASIVLMVFFSLKYRFRQREKTYELERMQIERGEQLAVTSARAEFPLTVFIRRLLIAAIVGFGILAWVGVVNLGYMRFFSSLLLWMLIVGVGYAVVYLFRLYVQRRDDNR